MREVELEHFFSEPLYEVKGKQKDANRKPKINIKDQASFIACKLAKIGYFNGNPLEVLHAPVDIVFNILNYESFENDYIDVYTKINEEA